MNRHFIHIQINKLLGEHKPGDTIKVISDKEGVPLDKYWRSRLKDAETDQCCEKVKPKKRTKKEVK